MKLNWLYTTAIALVVGAGVAIAQAPDAMQKRDEGTRAQSPAGQSKDRPAAGERMKERAGQAEQKGGAREMQRGERPAAGERGKQAQEPSGRAGREQTRQSQEQGREQGREQARDQDRRDRPAGTAQGKDEPKGGAAKQTTEDKDRMRDRDRAKQDRAQDTKQPADAKQQSRQQTDRDRRDQRDQRDQAAQPPGTSTQQTGRPTEGTQDQQRTGQAADRTDQRTSRVSEDQRRQVVDQLRRDRAARTDINVRVNVGERLPPRVQPRRLPPDIVRIVPHYRDYEYTVIDNRVIIVDPRRREVVEILDDEPGYGRAAGYGRERIVFSGEQRTRWRELARSSSATVGSTAPTGSATSSSDGGLAANCLSLQPVPEEMVRDRPELSNYRYLAVGEEIILVDPQQQKIVQVIDSQQ